MRIHGTCIINNTIVDNEAGIYGIVRADAEPQRAFVAYLRTRMHDVVGLRQALTGIRDYAIVWLREAPLGANYVMARTDFGQITLTGNGPDRLLPGSEQPGFDRGFVGIGQTIQISKRLGFTSINAVAIQIAPF